VQLLAAGQIAELPDPPCSSLLTSGIGGVPGALFYGRLADRVRRQVFITTASNFSLATAVIGADARQGRQDFPQHLPFFCGLLASPAGSPSMSLPLAGYYHDVLIGGVSVFYPMLTQ
jgi:predicted MFS family arabinose efflux permease